MKAAMFCWLLPAFVTSQSVTATTATLSPWQTGEVTPDGTCGGATGFVCSPVWGACCSKDGKCGRSAAFCGDGCQPAAGNCNAPAPAPAPPPGPGSISPDGSCGGANQYNCTTSPFGDCCSSSGYCGTTSGHCGSGCQDLFGICGAPTNISSDGQCDSNGKTCLGSTFGDCCSSGGYCGTSSDHCDAGCNAAFGTCSNAGSGSISTDGTCGKNGKTCQGSKFGDCCSSGGFCGTSKDHCQAGCQSQFGTCGAEDNVSTDGTCGTNGKTCKGSSFGDCCSSTGFCGKSTAHCDAGCNAAFGTCNEAASGISADGQCGKNGKTCKGSAFGDCCSSGGYCGKSSDHCDAGCNASFGTCNTAAGSISTDGTCGKNGKTCKGSTFGDCCSSVRAPQASQPMEIAVRRMARLAKVQPLVTAALLMVTAEKAPTIVVMAASCLTAFALESQVTQFAARKTARHALDLVLETAAQVEAIVEALALTVARGAKKIHRAAASQPTSRLLMALAALAREVSHVLVGLLMVSVVALQGFVERALRIAELAANLALDAAPRRREEFACFAISGIRK
ncbi:hypothetical protein CNYM01_00086 [Colletotrichum nymphaeae SA-01]|uniref:Chitin-binding type-1 domain-containing protein n=1 Tax=Colletotrichum nymphaeae SA-01 TaxID=1460502 RepID=A0A135UJP8_9PEZI|nr:hypothetical protein CNYM01_00086 [Colletotrichum nymphaeae SA-01]